MCVKVYHLLHITNIGKIDIDLNEPLKCMSSKIVLIAHYASAVQKRQKEKTKLCYNEKW